MSQTMSLAEYRRQKQPKYRNLRVTVDGETYDSKKEAARGKELAILARAGKIKNLRRQVPFKLTSHGKEICRYFADFTYQEPDGTPHIEDVKSFMTRKLPVYRIKKKLMAAHGHVIEEV
jgi:hypothetical protein